jgi:hypothetical protein
MFYDVFVMGMRSQHTFSDFLIPIAISSIKVYTFYKLHIV